MTDNSQKYDLHINLLRKKRWRFWFGTPICFAAFCFLFIICWYSNVPHLELILGIPYLISCIYCLWGVSNGRCPKCSKRLPALWHWSSKPTCRVCGSISLRDKAIT